MAAGFPVFTTARISLRRVRLAFCTSVSDAVSGCACATAAIDSATAAAPTNAPELTLVMRLMLFLPELGMCLCREGGGAERLVRGLALGEAAYAGIRTP